MTIIKIVKDDNKDATKKAVKLVTDIENTEMKRDFKRTVLKIVPTKKR